MTCVLDEKAAATQALGLFSHNTKSSFALLVYRDCDRPDVIAGVVGNLDGDETAISRALSLSPLLISLIVLTYLEESLKILERHSGYFHEDVRLQAIIALKHILTAAHAIFQCQNDGSMKAREVLDMVMNIYIKTMTEDDDNEVVANACMSIADVIKDYGYMV
ncbi:uncharacterized protein LOC120152011 [Hibiscus syriacus]|uniref:uncharacterized protein LOC120152011 n=1 Tax=Hibiscus syriacus TaxID=106335 RepID=UPI0019249B64|nr:uncharacterized protein LOC120152011 [Hibiscus syriacus]